MDGHRRLPGVPALGPGGERAEVVDAGAAGERAKEVYFEIEATPIKDSYTLAYDWHDDHVGHLDAGRGQDAQGHRRRLRARRPRGRQTEVTYALAVELAIPMIGMLRRKAEKVIIDTALKGLKKRVESLV